MAKKQGSHFECMECGHESTRWLGRCPACNAWNTFKEVKEFSLASKSASAAVSAAMGTAPIPAGPRVLEDLEVRDGVRFTSGFGEFDRVLGGGFMAGASFLLGGEPGIGKSTLLTQAAAAIGWAGGTVLYAHGEESANQVKLRWERLGLPMNNIHVLETCRIDILRDALESLKPRLLIIDSVQTLFDPALDSPPGSIQQAKFGVFALTEACRSLETSVCLVAHVTKEGVIAGPKVLEHMVDTVLYFEQAEGDVRFLRAQKNRFGATDELGFFRMDEAGLKEIKNAAEVFLENRQGDIPAGIVLSPALEGTRSFLVELQALVIPGKQGFSRLYSEKIDQRRVSRIAAVLEKHGSLKLSDHDLYIHVAGGIRIQDPSLDLALGLALHSARTGLSLPKGWAIVGELSLAGEVRTVGKIKKRIQAAEDAGCVRIIGPRCNETDLPRSYMAVASLGEAIRKVFGSASLRKDKRQGDEVADDASEA